MSKTTNPAEHRDLFGREIKVGDYIVYSAVDGRSGTLRVGQVLKLTYGKDYNKKDKLDEPKVFTKSWSNFESRGPGCERYGEEKNGSGRQKNVTLSFLDRLIVVDADTLSEKIKADLDGPIWEYDWNADGNRVAKP